MLFNIDTVEFSFDIAYDQNTKKILDALETKKSVQYINDNEGSGEKVLYKIGGYEFEVLGNGKKGFAYILHNSFFEINIARYRSKNKDMFPIFVRIKQEGLWVEKYETLYWRAFELINDNVGLVTADKISRLDICLHTDKFVVRENELEGWKGSFRNFEPHYFNRKVNALCFGARGSAVYCRVYDKTLEVKQKRKNWFFEIWKRNNLDTKNVWNIEFELRRDFFRGHGIDTVAQAFSSINDIWIKMVNKWLVRIDRDNSKTERCTIDAFWLDVMKLKQSKVELLKLEEQQKSKIETVIPALCGYLSTFASLINVCDIDTAKNILKAYSNSYYKAKKTTFDSQTKKKIQLLKGIPDIKIFDIDAVKKGFYDSIKEVAIPSATGEFYYFDENEDVDGLLYAQ
ncbi:MAG: replication initiation factor domain-containing protein [Clostridia bacterium]|nr:replication initiation factor domain-containing protein [Clostridia bacterium]